MARLGRAQPFPPRFRRRRIATRVLTATSATFTLAGQATGLLAKRLVSATTAATFSLTGQATGLYRTRLFTAASASFTLTGFATGLYRTRLFTASVGTFTLTGNAASFPIAHQIAAASRSFALTGNPATLTYFPVGAFTIAAATGSFTLTGFATGLQASRVLSAAARSFTWTGNDAALTFGPVGQFSLAAGSGVFALTGYDTGLQYVPIVVPPVFETTGGSGARQYKKRHEKRLLRRAAERRIERLAPLVQSPDLLARLYGPDALSEAELQLERLRSAEDALLQGARPSAEDVAFMERLEVRIGELEAAIRGVQALRARQREEDELILILLDVI